VDPPAVPQTPRRKHFCRPPSNWNPPGIAKPRFFETLFYGNHYQLGAIVSPEKPTDYAVGVWDACTFKISSFNSIRGLDYFGANSQTVDRHAAPTAFHFRQCDCRNG